MKIVKKYSAKSSQDEFQKKAANYTALANEFIKSGNFVQSFKDTATPNSLHALIALAATALAPNMAQAQCITEVNNNGSSQSTFIDLDGDNQPDLGIYYGFNFFQSTSTFTSMTTYGTITLTFMNTFSTHSIRLKSFNNNNLGILVDGNDYVANAASTQGNFINNATMLRTDTGGPLQGNFPLNQIGTASISFNGNFYFLELKPITLNPYNMEIVTINGIPAQNCDPDGCLDEIILMNNTAFLQSEYHADSLVRTNNIVEPTESVTLKAGDFIELKEGFHAKSGTGVTSVKLEDCPAPPLPLVQEETEMMVFNAFSRNKTIELSWVTLEPTSNVGFELQRSTNNKDFTKIGWLASKGEGHQEYDYVDEDIQPNVKYYYRLQQVDDFDNLKLSDTRHSKIIAIDDTQIGNIFPNPSANGLFNIPIDVPQNQTIEIEVFDAKGLLLEMKKVEVYAGESTIQLDLPNLPSGTFFTKIQIGENRFYDKVVIVK